MKKLFYFAILFISFSSNAQDTNKIQEDINTIQLNANYLNRISSIRAYVPEINETTKARKMMVDDHIVAYELIYDTLPAKL